MFSAIESQSLEMAMLHANVAHDDDNVYDVL